jgi:hypothetical protein
MVEVQLNNDTKVPQFMMVAFAVCTTLLVYLQLIYDLEILNLKILILFLRLLFIC